MFGICPKKMSFLDNLSVNDVRFLNRIKKIFSIIYYRIKINVNDVLMILHDENILQKNLWFVSKKFI